jgi:hypothetical protein
MLAVAAGAYLAVGAVLARKVPRGQKLLVTLVWGPTVAIGVPIVAAWAVAWGPVTDLWLARRGRTG